MGQLIKLEYNSLLTTVEFVAAITTVVLAIAAMRQPNAFAADACELGRRTRRARRRQSTCSIYSRKEDYRKQQFHNYRHMM